MGCFISTAINVNVMIVDIAGSENLIKPVGSTPVLFEQPNKMV